MRLFVALELPAAVSDELARATAALRSPSLRPLGAETLHLTLCFMGDQPDPARVRSALVGVLAPGLRLSPVALVGPRWLPHRAPRVLAAELDDPGGALARLSQAVHTALGRVPERRRFLPHVTLARTRGRLDDRPAITLPALPAFTPGPVALMRSHLGRGPARYERLAVWPIR